MRHLLKDVKKGSAFNSSVMSAINCSHPLGHRKNKRVIGKHLLLLFDYAKAFYCVDHNKLENSSRDGNTRPPDLPPEKSVFRSRSNS